jgi:hypothetical protein
MRRTKPLRILVVLICVAAPASASPAATRVIRGSGFTVRVAPGWRGRVVPATKPAPPAANLANFALPPAKNDYGNTGGSWPARAILVTVIDWTRASRGPRFRAGPLPLAIRRRDFTSGFEGVPSSHAFARRGVTVTGRRLEIWVQLGSERVRASTLRLINQRLADIHPVAR